MNDDRIGSLEQRVAVVEHDVTEIKQGLVQIHADLRENTKVTQDVANNTRDIVTATRATSFLFTVIAKVAALAAGVAGLIYLAQQASKAL
jgi:hypothetical protein